MTALATHPRAGVREVGALLYQTWRGWRHHAYLIHSLTSRCNARCGFCAWNPEFYTGGGDELGTEEVKRLYTDARTAGFVALSFWGGEPLVRRDFGELAAHAHALGFITSVITNGALLERRMDEVVPYVDRICISVDHPSERHDAIRGVKGLFGKILAATLKIKGRHPGKKIVFNCTLQRANVDTESLEEMARLLRVLGVWGAFNAMRLDPAGQAGDTDLQGHSPGEEELVRAFEHVRRLKRMGYPILNSETHLEKMTHPPLRYRCHWPKFMLPIEANGDVVDCMHWGTRPVANVRTATFDEILRSPRLRELAGSAGEACHRCVSLHRIDVSEIWEGHLEPLLAWSRSMG